MKLNLKSRFITLIIILLGVVNLFYYYNYKSICYAFPIYKIVAIEGKVLLDSSLSKFGMRNVVIKLSSCQSNNGDMGSATGVARVQYKGERLYSGDKVNFSITQGANGVKGKLIRLKRNSLNNLRAFVLKFLSERLPYSEEGELMRMLLLGFSLEYDNPIVSLAKSSGTSHVLALSGMNLAFFSYIFSTLSYPFFKENSKYLSYLLLMLYVVLVGPKPSLIRAIIFRGVFMITKNNNAVKNLFLTFSIHSCISLWTIGELSSLYSYFALLGILIFPSLFERVIPRFSFLVKYFAVSYSALIFTSPISLYYFGYFSLGAIVISGLLTPLLMILMLCATISLFSDFGIVLFSKCYNLIVFIMRVGSRSIIIKSYFYYFIFLIPLLFILSVSSILVLRGRKNVVV